MKKTTLLKPKLKYSTKNAKRKAKLTKKGRNSIKSAR
jgi:hypothetical protein